MGPVGIHRAARVKSIFEAPLITRLARPGKTALSWPPEQENTLAELWMAGDEITGSIGRAVVNHQNVHGRFEFKQLLKHNLDIFRLVVGRNHD